MDLNISLTKYFFKNIFEKFVLNIKKLPQLFPGETIFCVGFSIKTGFKLLVSGNEIFEENEYIGSEANGILFIKD